MRTLKLPGNKTSNNTGNKSKTNTSAKSDFNSGINNNPQYYQSQFSPPLVSKEQVKEAQSELKSWKGQVDNYGRLYGAKDAALELKAECHNIARKSETKQIGIEIKRVRESDTKQVEQLGKLYPVREEQDLRVGLAGQKANHKVGKKREQYTALMQKWA